jgi:replication initiation and membrane attachment protein DnaB
MPICLATNLGGLSQSLAPKWLEPKWNKTTNKQQNSKERKKEKQKRKKERKKEKDKHTNIRSFTNQ